MMRSKEKLLQQIADEFLKTSQAHEEDEIEIESPLQEEEEVNETDDRT